MVGTESSAMGATGIWTNGRGLPLFADVAERAEHLKRLGIADVFLDTPAYNAHTLGCGEFCCVVFLAFVTFFH